MDYGLLAQKLSQRPQQTMPGTMPLQAPVPQQIPQAPPVMPPQMQPMQPQGSYMGPGRNPQDARQMQGFGGAMAPMKQMQPLNNGGKF